MKRTLIIIGSIIMIAIILILGWIQLFGAHLPYINNDPEKLARYLLDHHRNPEECWDIVIIDPFGPQGAQIRANCIYTYASLAKDPSACELLMPSSYGWSCLGGAQATAEACNVDGDISVSWPLGEDTLGEWKTITMQECKQKVVTDKVGKDCCFILEITGNSNIDSCKRFEGNSHFMSSCIAQLALKKKDENLCAVISDENKKSMCEVQARTLRKFNNIEAL